jgi:hypothetical protein
VTARAHARVSDAGRLGRGRQRRACPSEVVTYRAVSNNATIFGDTTRDDSR